MNQHCDVLAVNRDYARFVVNWY